MMRAKLKVSRVEKFDGGETLHFHAVGKSGSYDESGSDENNTYARFTPCANLTMTVNNPALLGEVKEGQEFYLDFTPAG